MSILIAFRTPERALVGVDTECSQPGGGFGEQSKLFPLVHMNGAIAFRGSNLFVAVPLPQIVLAGGDFDALSGRLPAILKATSSQAAGHAASLGMTEEFVCCADVLLVGFSPQAGCIVAHLFRQESLATGFVFRNVDCFFSPDLGGGYDDLKKLDIAETREGLQALALAISAHSRQVTPELAAGGRLIVAEIKRSAMAIEPACDFPARPAQAAAARS